jgi:hypothetical protein
MTTVASPLKFALRMEKRMLIQFDHLLRVLPAKDASAFAAMMTAMEESEGLLTGRRTADCRGAIGLQDCVSKTEHRRLSTSCARAKETRWNGAARRSV